MPHDPFAWLGKIEPEKPRNARLWDGTAAETDIVTPAEIRNAATLDDARRGAGMNPHLAHREDTRAAMVKGREDRERKERPKAAPVEVDDLNAEIPSQARRLDVLRAALARGDEPNEIRAAWPTWWASGKSTNTERMWCRDRAALRAEQAPVEAPETPMPKGMPIAPKRNAVSDVERIARRNRLRTHLETNGPATREALRTALGYGHESAGKQLLNKDLEHLGAKGIPGEAVSLPDRDEKPVERAPYTNPTPRLANAIGTTPEHDDLIRPDLAVDATRYLQASAKSGKSVVLTADMARALLAELKVDVD